MSEQQIKNLIDLCKGNSLGSALRVLALYRQPQLDALAKYFGCDSTKDAIALHLIY